MSIKAARGTKRVCEKCGARFYDLNRDPIVCPSCQAHYHLKQPAVAGKPARISPEVEEEAEEEDEAVLGGEEGELVSLEEVEEDVGEVPDIEDEDLEGIEDDKDADALIEPDEDEEDDVSGIIGSPRESKEDDG